MSNITKATIIGLPAFIGLGLVWIGVRIISNEKKLETRIIEMEHQLDTKPIKGLGLNNDS